MQTTPLYSNHDQTFERTENSNHDQTFESTENSNRDQTFERIIENSNACIKLFPKRVPLIVLLSCRPVTFAFSFLFIWSICNLRMPFCIRLRAVPTFPSGFRGKRKKNEQLNKNTDVRLCFI